MITGHQFSFERERERERKREREKERVFIGNTEIIVKFVLIPCFVVWFLVSFLFEQSSFAEEETVVVALL